ncbi:hypothetical protein SADUNF_Sadunf09G0100600 [Salix dunnii]|uniref:Uncharacterized protein n=1 Tax=Salix dunnii TaxID=1413687 RepID=A0A835JVX5_9ROSI|nr:hypothetical protein SADUNF_Sadunf09G0100600 [Salix dunnii]
MNFNTLSGAIPAELGWIKKLTFLALSMNRFTGAIPVSLFILTDRDGSNAAKVPSDYWSYTWSAIFFFALQRLLSPDGILNQEPTVQYKLGEVKASGFLIQQLVLVLQNGLFHFPCSSLLSIIEN